MPSKGPRGVELLQGETFTLASSAARTATAGTNGTAVFFGGERKRLVVLLNVTAAGTEVDDTLDVYIDHSFDNATWFNGGNMTRVLGNGGAKKFFAVFDPSAPGTSAIDVTSDAASGAIRPSTFGAYIRARWIIVDAGGTAASFTFSVTGYAV